MPQACAYPGLSCRLSCSFWPAAVFRYQAVRSERQHFVGFDGPAGQLAHRADFNAVQQGET